MTQAAQLAQYGSNNVGLSFKNRIINGDMTINQRGVTSGVTSGYFVDRWALSGCSTSSVLTSSLPTGFTTGISISATSGNPIAIQKIESKNCSDLSGQSVTLSFYAQSISNATTLYASLAYANSADNFGATTTISEQNLGTLTGSWVKYTYTWNNLPSGALNGLAVNILCAGTSTFTMGITGVQLEVGSVATSFDYLPYGTELMLCQRYFLKLGGDSTYQKFAMGMSANTNNSYAIVVFPVQMRANPTMSYSSLSDFRWTQGTNSWTASVLGVDQYSVLNTFMQIDAAGSPFTQYRPGWLDANGTLNSKLMFSAEL